MHAPGFNAAVVAHANAVRAEQMIHAKHLRLMNGEKTTFGCALHAATCIRMHNKSLLS